MRGGGGAQLRVMARCRIRSKIAAGEVFGIAGFLRRSAGVVFFSRCGRGQRFTVVGVGNHDSG